MADYTHARLTDWAEGDHATMPLGTQTALLESFIAHARVLDEFLGGRRRAPRPSDVTANDYLPTWAGRGVLSDEIRDLTDKQQLHLTVVRAQRRQWPVHAIGRNLVETYLQFFHDLGHV
jgi:hypothetical protein